MQRSSENTQPKHSEITITQQHRQNQIKTSCLPPHQDKSVETVFFILYKHEWQLMVSPLGREMRPDIFIYADCVQIPAGVE